MELLKKIEELKNKEIKELIDKRIKEFENVKKQDIFSELCFCILTANSTAENCIRVQKEAGEHFETLPEKELAERFKEVGCRFHTKRAGYIAEARKHKEELLERVINVKNLNREVREEQGLEENKLINNENKVIELREWIADNIKGLGMKESSHFLRNIGFKDVAIIDFHILDILHENKLIDKTKFKKSLRRADYLEIERVLKNIAERAKLNLAELDLYLWYIETGKVLK